MNSKHLAIGLVIGTIGLVGQAIHAGSEMADWRTDPVWYDGKAEYAVYDAQRTIYGTVRDYQTVIITNKQYMDPATTTKASDWQADDVVEVFKHNVREVIPTENYDYKFLTTSFVRTDESLTPFKLVMSSQEDCGATYKQYVMADNRLKGDQFVYFPDAGHMDSSQAVPAQSFMFFDGLGLTLRNYPFPDPDRVAGGMVTMLDQDVTVLPEQTDTHSTSMEPRAGVLKYGGVDTVRLGDSDQIMPCHKLTLELEAGSEDGEPDVSHFWFAADGDSGWLHILVKYEGFDGVKMTLNSVRRWAYWER
ncbi:MAG: hypothetical protein HND57_12670 [Planctomycetes bacterium]|nr:hypothetical protein [Planctomycetota bacterium]